MKKPLINLLTLFSLLIMISGCTTSSVMGLSRASHVAELQHQMEEDSRRSQQIQNDLENIRNKDNEQLITLQKDLMELNGRMEELQKVSEQLDQIIASLDENEENTKELQKLADEFKTRLATVHKDTLSVLVTALEEYIEDSSDARFADQS